MKQHLDKWDDQFAAMQSKLAEAQRAAEKVSVKLGETRSRYERARSFLARARKKEAEVRSSGREARRRGEEARRRGDEARRKGLGQHRWIAESRLWNNLAHRQADDLLRWGEETRRKDRELRSMHEEVKSCNAELTELSKDASVWEQKLKYLALHRGGRLPLGDPTPDANLRPLSFTEWATAALKDILDGMEHDPDQALRLNAGPDGGITLTLDTAKQGDNIVDHKGTAVLFIDSPVPESLQGRTLDVSGGPGAPTMVLSS